MAFTGFNFNQTQSQVSPAVNLEANKEVAASIEARVYGIADVVLNNPDMVLYTAQGFRITCEPCPSTKGDIFYNFMIRDTMVEPGEKDEVARVKIASVINGKATVDDSFAYFFAKIRKELNDYVIEKKLNFWNRPEKKKQERKNLADLKVG